MNYEQYTPAVKPMILVFGASTTWSPTKNTTARVYVVGAGGGGAAGRQYSQITGGAGGGCAIKILQLRTDVTYTITIGASGSGTSATVSGEAALGTNGGNTSFAGTGFNTIYGYGGKAGVITGNTATGGSSANGDYNFSGESCVTAGITNGGVCGIAGTPPDDVSGTDSSAQMWCAVWRGLNFYGGTRAYGSGSVSTTAGNGMRGCGGGAAYCTATATSATSGKGGAGLVIIEGLEL